MAKVCIVFVLLIQVFSLSASAQEKQTYHQHSKKFLVQEPALFRSKVIEEDQFTLLGLGTELVAYKKALKKRVETPRLGSIPFFVLGGGFAGVGTLLATSRSKCRGFTCVDLGVASVVAFAIAGSFLLTALIWMVVDISRHGQAKKRLKCVRQNIKTIKTLSSGGISFEGGKLRF